MVFLHRVGAASVAASHSGPFFASTTRSTLRQSALINVTKRSMLLKTVVVPKFTVPEVQQTVQQLLFDYAAPSVPAEKVTLDASLRNVLLADKHERYILSNNRG
ncbi:hypothetical protein HDU82_000484 [Entophlyctis luteolus]|nr:hypothetical protein HDU82_000484 [Entophlyctis luteolus]